MMMEIIFMSVSSLIQSSKQSNIVYVYIRSIVISNTQTRNLMIIHDPGKHQKPLGSSGALSGITKWLWRPRKKSFVLKTAFNPNSLSFISTSRLWKKMKECLAYWRSPFRRSLLLTTTQAGFHCLQCPLNSPLMNNKRGWWWWTVFASSVSFIGYETHQARQTVHLCWNSSSTMASAANLAR